RASRSVSALAVVSTMRAAPLSSKWVRSDTASVPRHGRVDEGAVGVDAALEGDDVLEAGLDEDVGPDLAAHAVMAVDDDSRALRHLGAQAVEAAGQAVERFQYALGELRLLVLPRLAHVEQEELRAGLLHLLELLDGDLRDGGGDGGP